MKVFLVTDGSYSDYRVLAVCSSESSANKAKTHFNAGNDIEEWELDEYGARDDGFLRYSVRVVAKGLVVASCERESTKGCDGKTRCLPYGDGHSLEVRCVARDEDHAIKIAVDEAAKYVSDPNYTLDHSEWWRRVRSEGIFSRNGSE